MRKKVWTRFFWTQFLWTRFVWTVRALFLAALVLCGSARGLWAQVPAGSGAKFTAADYLADIDELERRMVDQSSYLQRNKLDPAPAIAALRKSIHEETELAAFVLELRRLIARIGDAHGRVISPPAPGPRRFLPFWPADTATGIAALSVNSGKLLDEECPYLESIDGLPLEQWMAAGGRFVAQASPQLVRRRSLEEMGQIEVMRAELGLPSNEIVEVGLKSADGARTATKRLRVSGQPYHVATVKLSGTRQIEGNIGYLLIPEMREDWVDRFVDQMKSLQDTNGLIIDVRENGGGTYGIMRALYGFFVPDDAKPKVTNIAAYRLSPSFARNHIEYRPTYRADWEGWTDVEREVIREAAANFKPEWILPEGKFSDWHYMILGRTRSGRGGPSQRVPGGISNDYFYYDKPVVVLANAGSFSAADGFVNAFGELPQVTVIGEPSAGGSGATKDFNLPKTRVWVGLATMASFRPNGRLFDGNGIEVDIVVRPPLEDFTRGSDTVLARAVEFLKEKSR